MIIAGDVDVDCDVDGIAVTFGNHWRSAPSQQLFDNYDPTTA